MKQIETVQLETDVLVIGGGAAGCYAGIKLKEENEDVDVLIAEKAQIERSGCLAAGINALNAYLNPGVTAKDFLEYVKQDSEDLVRDDLVYSIAKGVNEVAYNLEEWGLPFLKDEQGNYVAKGTRSVKIKGEQIKPILAQATLDSGVDILNRVNITNYLVVNNRVRGAVGFSVRENKFYIIKAKAVICATGGAAGIYKPNNPGQARHKMWYSPFNTGAGYAMGIRAGAEMTTFEMRFIALRVKDVISPTGTLAQGFNANQINVQGEEYQKNYEKNSTPLRLHATIKENQAGRGPCYLNVNHLDKKGATRLKRTYLNMSPGIVLQWADNEVEPNQEPIEINGTEPYVVGGHSQSGYWVDVNRKTTIEGLYAAGDVVGGAPKKYATGCMVEGEIAASHALDYIKSLETKEVPQQMIDQEFNRTFAPLNRETGFTPAELEERLQKIMDEYAGGLSVDYQLHEKKLLQARDLLKQLKDDLTKGYATSMHQLMKLHEVIDRVDVARVLVEHLLYRKETRWKAYQQRIDYPQRDDDNWFKFVNSVYDQSADQIQIIEREHVEVGELDGS
ncbi:succinate dehydrogenase/fumarate reductase flavoprotein subunit [Halobacteroides halobius DSM 5150]|uniref:Succinate dehydrogenase/fumarate reductase flavoprotein subunit n=1 Tax=Halobacteroides halobius (strain ATCC 35273 / DSM 5150 / MD-1) TaxID=748449 RepID=L0KA80_HALHC|nr:adenylyl-sulfate reductase subunit alpha [Halobacteroides halobius]AGB42212.1 succinate dehydrogenase/fumarate reductase flavoprotein subunit [Halobacteroides halobius DSM 5150]